MLFFGEGKSCDIVKELKHCQKYVYPSYRYFTLKKVLKMLLIKYSSVEKFCQNKVKYKICLIHYKKISKFSYFLARH